jgi:hypothetical protein
MEKIDRHGFMPRMTATVPLPPAKTPDIFGKRSEGQTSTVRALALEAKQLARLVPGLILRGSIPCALRCPSGAGLEAHDIDLLVIDARYTPLQSVVNLIFKAVASGRASCPLLFAFRERVTIDVRTRKELASKTNWYEWASCREDALTLALPFDIKREINGPTLTDLLDYMEYLTFIGLRPYFRQGGIRAEDDRTALRKVRTFLETVAPFHAAETRLAIVYDKPLDSFETILQTIHRHVITDNLRRRLTGLHEWFGVWQSARQASESRDGHEQPPLNPAFLPALIKWRTAGKPWVSRDIESRVLWKKYVSAFRHRCRKRNDRTPLQLPSDDLPTP